MRSISPNSSAVLAAPILAGKQGFFRTGQLRRPALLHQVDEGIVDFALDRLKPFDVLGLLRQERIEHDLVLAGGVDPPLDPELLDRLVEAERGADHADRPDDRGRIADDLVGRAGDHVAARGRDVLDEAITGRFFSSASWRMRRKIRCDCTAEPPGELITSATAFAPRTAKALSRARARPAIVRPGPQRGRKSDHAGEPHDRNDRDPARQRRGSIGRSRSRPRRYSCRRCSVIVVSAMVPS